MKTKEELTSEYIRTALFGEGLKRRPHSLIEADFRQLVGDDCEEVLKGLNETIEALKLLGIKAEEFAQQGIQGDSLELENLALEAQKLALNVGQNYVLTKFRNAIPTVTKFEESSSKKKKKVKQQVISGEDFFAGNAFAPQLLPADGNFPAEWLPCTYDEETIDFGQLMYKYCYCGLWEEGKSRDMAMGKILTELKKLFVQERIDNAKAVADAWLKRAIPLCKAALERNVDTNEQRIELEALGGPLLKNVNRERNHQAEKKKKAKTANQHTVKINNPAASIPKSTYDKTPAMERMPRNIVATTIGHQNEIYRLTPSEEWNLYIDESGADDSFETNGAGIIAGALSDAASSPLPEQPQLHASTDSTDAKMTAGDKLISTLLNHKNCGVLAIPASAYSSAQGWASLIGSFIDLVLRLLPLTNDKKKVKLNVFVEGRAPYVNDVDFDFVRDACRYNLMHVFPERANRIDFTIQTMGKDDKYNAYPDLIANTCFQKSNLARKRFVQTGWNGTCFLKYPASELRNLLEYFFTGRHLPPAEWDALLQAASKDSGLLKAIIKTIGFEAQGNVELWREYLDWTVAHLSSKAINLRKLHAQLDWLKLYQPADAELPPRVKLLWLTSKLAEANHLGEIEKQSPVGQEFLRLVKELYEEDAPLVCWAVLHLAVQKTNAYQFEEAKKLVTEFSDIASLFSKEPPFARFLKDIIDNVAGTRRESRNYVPAAIPGLRYYGQLLSSCGQHEAFLGNPKTAIIYFKEAIACFGRLSEKKDREIDQTRAYYATAQMDLNPQGKETEAVMEAYLGMPIVEAAKHLASSLEDEEKYHHHILLRYLVQSHNQQGIQAYLAEKKNWKVGEGHPWEMIEFYRALLLEDKTEKTKHLKKADALLANERGITLKAIECVVLGALRFYDQLMDTTEYEKLTESVIQGIPALGAERVQALRRQISQPVSPLEFAKAILPFNFR